METHEQKDPIDQKESDLKAIDRLFTKFVKDALEQVVEKGESEITANVSVTVTLKLSSKNKNT